MSIRVNIANQVRQTTVLAWRPLLPLFEAVMNSFQAIKEAQLSKSVPGRITIEVVREVRELDLNEPAISGFRITDNGVGLDDRNFDSFNTAFSPHKLSRGGKGLGRFTWLKAFESAKVESTFKSEEKLQRRSFVFDEHYDTDNGTGVATTATQAQSGTTIELVRLGQAYQGQCPRSTDVLIQKIIEHFILVFLDKSCPEVFIIDLGHNYKINSIFEKDYEALASSHSYEIKGHIFTLHGFRIPTSRATKHKLVYAADQRAVLSDRLDKYLPNLSIRLEDDDGKPFFYLGIVQSSYLSIIPKAEIRTRTLALVEEDLREVITQINSLKLERVRRYVRDEAPQYRILLKNADQFLNKLPPVPTKAEMESTLHRQLFDRETELKRESTRIIKEASKITDYDSYHNEFTSFLEEYNELGASALAQYIQHRRIILDFLERAIKLPEDKKNYPLEKVVHHLVFPMQQTSEDIPSCEQNLWMIDERLTFHSFISSDKKNKSIPLLETGDNQRGDIVIFDEKIIFSDERPDEGHPLNSIVVIEFKQPGRNKYTSDENPVLQAAKVINAIRESKFKHKGRTIPIANAEIPAMIFVVADLTPKLRQLLVDFNATMTPDKQGYYGYHANHKVYYEVMDYTKMLSDARKRNRIFFDKLNLVENR